MPQIFPILAGFQQNKPMQWWRKIIRDSLLKLVNIYISTCITKVEKPNSCIHIVHKGSVWDPNDDSQMNALMSNGW